MNATVVSVSQINRYVKSLLDDDKLLQSLFVVGEISNFRENYMSGHLYFSLKDQNSTIKAVMWSSDATRLNFIPTDGMKVICQARLSVYEKDGSYQLYITYMQPDGAGINALKFEQLKNKLEKEGLFDSARKIGVPRFPEKVVLITSDTSAAVKDVLSVHKRRFPLSKIILIPVTVQGFDAAETITRAIKYADEQKLGDVILMTRGGGSAEDLSAFNEEELVRAVANCRLPIVSAVGHETDFTLSDFAADLRAPTPSAAAEMIFPDKAEILDRINYSRVSLKKSVESLINTYYYRLLAARNSFVFSDRENICKRTTERLKLCETKITELFEKKCSDLENRFQSAVKSLELVSPLKIMLRGFAVVEKNDEIIKSINEIKPNDNIKVTLSDGVAECNVKSVVDNNG